MNHWIQRALFVTFLVIVATGTPTCALALVWVSPGGQYAAFNDYGGTLSVWKLADGTESCRIVLKESIQYCAISESAGLIATSTGESGTQGVFVWSIQTGEQLWRAPNQCKGIEFFPDGKHLVTASNQDLVILRSVDGTQSKSLGSGEVTDPFNGPPTIGLSPSGDRIYSYATNGGERLACIRSWDADNGAHLGDFVLREDYDKVRLGGFSVGNDFVAQSVFIDQKFKVILWDVNTRSEVRRFDLDDWYFYETIFLLEERERLFVPITSNFVREFDLRSGKIVSEFEIPEFAQHGWFDSAVPWPVFGTDMIVWEHRLRDGDAFGLFLGRRSDPRRRGIVGSIQVFKETGQSAILLAGGTTGIVKRNPERVYQLDVSPVTSKDSSRFTMQFKKTRQPSSSVREDRPAVQKMLADLLAPVPETSARKKIDRSKERLFVLSVGVSDHQQDEYDLKYAAADALALSDRLEKERGRLFGDVQVKVYADKEATPEGIREGLEWLKRSSTSRDLVIVFFSGHGIRAKKGLYYFSHTGDEENIQNTCINWSDVAVSLANTKAAQVIFVSDCCHAGAFSKERYVNQKEIANTIDRVEQLTILASSTGDEKSVELDGAVNHGALTQALLEGLNGKADTDRNGEITWSELETYARSRVSDLTGGEQHPTVLKSAKDVASFRLGSVSDPANGAKPKP